MTRFLLALLLGMVIVMPAAFSQGPALVPEFDAETGVWTGLKWGEQELLPAIRSDVELSLQGSELPPVTERKLVDYTREGNLWRIAVTSS
jgi:hypothetical protein